MEIRHHQLGVLLRRYILSPIYWKYIKYSQVLDYLQELRNQQWNSMEENQAIQAGKLCKLLKYASENIPYYKKIVRKRGIKVREDRVFDDLKKFPILTKVTIREHFHELYRFRDKTYYLNRSGGSTGEPVKFYQDRHYADWSLAVKLLFNEWAGCPLGTRIVKFWGSERDVFQGSQGIKGKLGSLLHNVKLINAFNISEDDIYDFLDFLKRWKPEMIVAYVEPLYEVAKFASQRGLPVYSPRSIMTSAGTLFPDFRAQIETTFRAPVFNRYGSREVGDMACECPEHRGLHILPMTHVLEIVNSNGETCPPGRVGEVLVTSLENFTMPFIRYKIGDLAVMSNETCPCGRGTPMLRSIEGRSTSIFINQRGEIISPEYFIHLIGVVLNKNGLIRKFQVVQEQVSVVIVRLVVTTRDTNILHRLFAEIKGKIQLVMGEDTIVEFELVDDIPPSPSGKFLYTISKVKHEKN